MTKSFFARGDDDIDLFAAMQAREAADGDKRGQQGAQKRSVSFTFGTLTRAAVDAAIAQAEERRIALERPNSAIAVET